MRTALLLAAVSLSAAVSPLGQPASAEVCRHPEHEVLVGYRSSAAAEQVRGRLRDEGTRTALVSRSGPVLVDAVVTGCGLSAERLAKDPGVAFVEPDGLIHVARRPAPTSLSLSDPLWKGGLLWGMRGGYGSQAEQAWIAGHRGSAGTFVAVVDEGIEHGHEDLTGQVGVPGEIAGNGADDDDNGYVDDAFGWDFRADDASVYDGGAGGFDDRHGTHVAGTIAARADNAVGAVGISWHVGLISAKFMSQGTGTTSDAVRAIDYVTALARRGVRVVAMTASWGTNLRSQALEDAVARAASAGILIVAAAGNSGTNNDANPVYPAGYDTRAVSGHDGVVSVAALAADGTRQAYSNYGPASVDLGAPGDDIWSTSAGGRYDTASGTSMSVPHVAGAAAVYAAAHPTATAGQIRAALLSTAEPTRSMKGKTASGGRLNVARLLG